MKKFLSLILAALMVAGCMSFSAFAEGQMNIAETLKNNGVAHAVLTEPIGTAPVQDGSIGEGEYSESRQASYVTTGVFGAPYTEYFAYDNDYLYYAVESSAADLLGQTMAFTFKANQMVDSFGGFLNAPNMMSPSTDTNGVMLAYNSLPWCDKVGHLFVNGTVTDLSLLGHSAAIYAPNGMNDMGPTNGAPYGDAYRAVTNIGVTSSATNDDWQTVFEIRVARKCFADNNVYAYYFAGSNWSGEHTVTVGTALNDTTKAALGTDAAMAPGFIVIDEPDEPISIPDVLAANGVAHAVLTEPIATAPVQDGVIGDGEYSISREVSAVTEGTLAGAEYTEYFAYDAEWLYYAVKSNEAEKLGATLAFYFRAEEKVSSVDGFLNIPNMLDKSTLYATNGVLAGYNTVGLYDMKGHVYANTTVTDLSRFNFEAGVLYGSAVDYSPTDTGMYAVAYPSLTSVGTDNATGTETCQTVFETKVSRKCYAETDNVYAYQFSGLAMNGPWTESKGTVTIGTALDDTTKAALGTDAAMAPGFIVIDEPDAPTEYNVPEILEETGVEHIKLSEYSNVAPKVDGKVSRGEYTKVIETTFTSEYDPNGILWTKDLNEYLVGQKFTEYFAFDDEWVYYAAVASDGFDFGYSQRFYVEGAMSNQSRDSLATTLNRKAGDMFAFNEWGDTGLSDKGIWIGTQGLSDKILANYDVGSDGNVGKCLLNQYGGTYRDAYLATGEVAVDVPHTEGVANETLVYVFETKFSREYFESDINTYGFSFQAHKGGTRFATRLNAEQQVALYTDSDFAPRYIVIEDKDIVTKAGASVRISTTNSGLRFKTQINKAYLAELSSVSGNVIEVGTLIAPTVFIGTKFTALKHEFVTLEGDAVNCVEVKANVNDPFASDNINNIYAGSLVSIKEENLDKAFSAVGYVKVTNGNKVEYYYSDIVTSKTVDGVATAALEDTSSVQEYEYQYAVEGQAVYSPYTKAQREIISKLVKQ